MNNQDQPPSRLRWHCRRGMQELDVLLGGWLEQCWSEASDELREAFAALLEEEDDRIWAWVTGREQPTDAVMQSLIGELRDGFRQNDSD